MNERQEYRNTRMIRATDSQTRSVFESAESTTRATAGATAAQSDFQRLFRNEGAAASATSLPEVAPATEAPDASEAVPFSSTFASPFSPQSVENTMNQWLMGLLRQQNLTREQGYQNVLDGWKNVNAHNREMGLPETPPPPPPEMAEVAPMPEGWWFKITS